MQDYVGDSDHRNPWIAIALTLLAAIAVGWFIQRRPLGVEESPPSFNQAPAGDSAAHSPLRSAFDKNIDQPRGSAPAQQDGNSVQSHEASPAWSVPVDPPADTLSWPREIRGSIPRSFGQSVLFSSGFGAFVAIGQNGGEFNGRTIWDLRRLQQTGRIPKPHELTWPMALSPDGRWLAGRVRTASASVIEVCSAQDDRKNQRIALDANATGLDVLDFLEEGRLLTGINTPRGKLFQIWNFDSGTEVVRFLVPGLVGPHTLALSPGRNYLAALDSDRILVFDLRSGIRAGELKLSKPTGFQLLRGDGIAFSPDGQELAVFCHDASRSRLLSLRIVNGEVSVDHSFSKLLLPTAHGRLYSGVPLEWLPDRSAWLMYGEFLIDYVSGGLIWQLPMTGVDPATPRRLLGNDQLLLARNNRRDRDLQVFDLPRQEIAATAAAARAGQDPNALVLPAVRSSNLSGARTIAAPPSPVPWNLAADPRVDSEASRLSNAIALNARIEHIQRLLFSNRSAGRAAIVESIPANPLSLTRRLRVEQIDLIAGKSKGYFDLFTASLDARVAINADLSPAGTRLAVRDPREGLRLDLWSVEERRYMHGWAPYAGKSGASAVIRWLAFLDDDHLLTASGDGVLVLWNVAQCRAIYTIDNCRGGWCFSPGRKYLAFFNGSTFEFIEASSGEWRGRMALPTGSQFRNCTNAAFRPDSEQFAALFTDSEGRAQCVCWELKQGGVRTTVSVPRGGDLEWCGLNQVLVGGMLVNLTHQISYCNYVIPSGYRATNAPDGRHWFALQRRPSDPVTLNAQSLPDATAREIAQRLDQLSTSILLTPGSSIGLKLEVNRSAKDAVPFHAQLREHLLHRLKVSGLVIDENAELVFRLQIQERATGEVPTYPASPGLKETPVAAQQLACRIELIDRQGKILWYQEKNLETPEFRLGNNGQTFESKPNEQLWKTCENWVNGVRLPYRILRQGEQLEVLPKQSVLTGDP